MPRSSDCVKYWANKKLSQGVSFPYWLLINHISYEHTISYNSFSIYVYGGYMDLVTIVHLGEKENRDRYSLNDEEPVVLGSELTNNDLYPQAGC